MKVLLKSALVLLGWALVSPVAAWDGAVVTNAAADLQHEVMGVASPVPGWCYWSLDPGLVQSFAASNGDGDGSYCDNPWQIQCQGDSLVFEGSWVESEDQAWVRSALYRVELVSTLTVSSPTRIQASRSVAGDLAEDQHGVTIEFPGGLELDLLVPGSGPDQADVILPVGDYEIRISIYARDSRPIAAYQGRTSVSWSDPATLPEKGRSWGSLKALFRP